MNISVKRGGTSLTIVSDGQPFPLQDLLCDLERAVIGHLLEVYDTIKARVAEHLFLNRTTLVEKARKYGFPLKIYGR